MRTLQGEGGLTYPWRAGHHRDHYGQVGHAVCRVRECGQLSGSASETGNGRRQLAWHRGHVPLLRPRSFLSGRAGHPRGLYDAKHLRGREGTVGGQDLQLQLA